MGMDEGKERSRRQQREGEIRQRWEPTVQYLAKNGYELNPYGSEWVRTEEDSTLILPGIGYGRYTRVHRADIRPGIGSTRLEDGWQGRVHCLDREIAPYPWDSNVASKVIDRSRAGDYVYRFKGNPEGEAKSDAVFSIYRKDHFLALYGPSGKLAKLNLIPPDGEPVSFDFGKKNIKDLSDNRLAGLRDHLNTGLRLLYAGNHFTITQSKAEVEATVAHPITGRESLNVAVCPRLRMATIRDMFIDSTGLDWLKIRNHVPVNAKRV